MKKLCCCLILFLIGNYAFAQTDSLKGVLIANVQLRADLITPIESQFAYLRKKNLGFSLKIATSKYTAIAGLRLNNLFNSYYGFYHNLSVFTFKPGIILPLEITNRKMAYITFNGVVSYVKNEATLYYSSPSLYSEVYKSEQLLLGAEVEVTESINFFKNLNTGFSIALGYKPMEVYNLQGLINNYPTSSYYAPTQGYSPWPIYVSVSAFLGLKYKIY